MDDTASSVNTNTNDEDNDQNQNDAKNEDNNNNNNNNNLWKASCENGGEDGGDNGPGEGGGDAGGDSVSGGDNNLPPQEKSNTSSTDDSQICSTNTTSTPPGPDPIKLKAILDRTNYPHQVTAGQRKYGGPPADWTDPPPPAGCEIFVGKIPKDVYEDELIPLFEKIGKIWDLRLMIDPITSQSRGYAFITYCNREDAQKAVQELDGHKIRSKGYTIKVNISVPNLRLFIGNIPKVMSKESIFHEFSKVTEGLVEVIIYSSPDDRKKNRGFCFLEFDSHKNASAAKRKLTTTGMKIFKSDILVDWADPQEEPDEETMSKVKVLYVRNLTSDVTEQQLKELFEKYGNVERVKKIKDYAFIHFEDRTQALNAMENLVGTEFGGSSIEISLAKPPSDRRKKEEVLRNRERRMIFMMQQKQLMTHNPRVPQSQLRLPIPTVFQLNTPILPMRHHHGAAVRNRFPPAYLNPLLSVPINRQNLSWNQPMLFGDPSDYWYGSSRAAVAALANAANGPQFNFQNVPPNNQWNYGLTNGQVPQLQPSFCPGGSSQQQQQPHNSNNNNNNNGGGGGPNNHQQHHHHRRNNHHHHGGPNGGNSVNQPMNPTMNTMMMNHNTNSTNNNNNNNASLFRKWRVGNNNHRAGGSGSSNQNPNQSSTMNTSNTNSGNKRPQ